MGRFGGLGSDRTEVARSEAHKVSTSTRTGAGGRMRRIWRRYRRKRSRASSRSLNWGQRIARSSARATADRRVAIASSGLRSAFTPKNQVISPPLVERYQPTPRLVRMYVTDVAVAEELAAGLPTRVTLRLA